MTENKLAIKRKEGGGYKNIYKVSLYISTKYTCLYKIYKYKYRTKSLEKKLQKVAKNKHELVQLVDDK